jgi:GNAT superfamily N-acetyltransferase
MVEINRAIQESDYTPLLMMEWGEQNWFQKPNDFKDLRQYGTDCHYPTFSTRICNIVKPNSLLLDGYTKLVLDSDFQKDFWGSNGMDISNHIKSSLPGFLKHVDVDFGRRLMIEWFITNKSNEFIGFIHLTCMSNAFPYKWVVEFGLVKEYRGRGIMKTVLRGIVNWAKENGCDQIYAISEEHNHPAHALLRNLPYSVTEKKAHMSDQFGGFRPMRNYMIQL